MNNTPENVAKSNLASYCKLTYECIPNETLRQYIFGTPEPVRRQISATFIPSMHNMMIMSFFALFSVWKEYRADSIRMEDGWGEEQRSAVHAKRVNDVMENIYCNNILTQETISFVLTEILLEVRKNYDSPFNGLIKGAVATSKFQKIAEIIRVWKISFQGAESNLDVLRGYYEDLISSLEILKLIELDESENSLMCRIKMPNGNVIESDISAFIKKIDNGNDVQCYYLYKATSGKSGVYLEYMNFGGNVIYKDIEDVTGTYVVNKNRFYALTCNSLDFAKPDDLSMSLQIKDFKYIHRLALCISDALGVGTKRDLLDRINEMDVYRDSFRDKDIEDVNWDNTVVLLMLEDGPSEIIEMVLKSDINAFENILKSVMIRFLSNNEDENTPITYKELKNEYLERERIELAYQDVMQNGISRNRKVRAWMKNARIFLMSQFIISKVAATEVKNQAFYAENITMKLQKINSAVEKNGALASLSIINKTLERVFRTIILFYKGILEYAKAREEKLSKYNLNDRHREKVLIEVQRASEDAFFNYVESRLSEKRSAGNTPIKEATLGLLLQEFKELCTQMDTTKGKSTVYNENSLLLHSVIGRRKICDISIFDKLTTVGKEKFRGVKNPPLTLAAFFNKVFKHDDPSVNADDPKVVSVYISLVKEIFEFLNLNDDYKHKDKLPVQNIFDPIFPYVVRYSERNENRDRCSVCQYIINTDGGFEDTKIKLLTEYNYVMNELYYCIPNQESSTKNWWVNPFLISCRRFDELLLNQAQQDKGENGR